MKLSNSLLLALSLAAPGLLPAAILDTNGFVYAGTCHVSGSQCVTTQALTGFYASGSPSGSVVRTVTSAMAEAFSSANYGVWKAGVILNADPTQPSDYNYAEGTAAAFAADEWIISVPGLTAGDMVTLTLALNLSQAITLTGPESQIRISIDAGLRDLLGNGQNANYSYFIRYPGGPENTSGELLPQIVFSFDAPAETPLEFSLRLLVEAQLPSYNLPQGRNATVDVGRTLTWASAQISQGGVPILNALILSGSGFDYNQSAVPEPATAWLAAAVLGLGLLRRRTGARGAVNAAPAARNEGS